MDWKVNHNDEEHQPNQRQDWHFSYWGGSLPQSSSSSNGIASSDFSESSVLGGETREPAMTSSFYSLSQAQVGTRVYLVDFRGTGGLNRLLSMDLIPGAELEILSCQPSGSVIIALEGKKLGLGAKMADDILVSNSPLQQSNKAITATTYVREMAAGTIGRVAGFDKALQGYQGKLLSMGLLPGTEFTVIRVTASGSVEIAVQGVIVSLRKQEADALVVEEVEMEG